MEEASEAPFFLSLQTPLPASTTEAALFIRDSPSGAVISLWNTHLETIETLVGESQPIDEQWNKLNPPFLKPEGGELKLAALMSLRLQFGLGGGFGSNNFSSASN